VARHKGHVCGY